MQIRRYAHLISMILGLSSIASQADNITLLSDPWCPYACNSQEQSGFMVDAAKAIFTKAGHTVEFQIVPWDKSIELVAQGQNNAIVGAYRADAPSFIFPTEASAFSRSCFFVKPTTTWKYTGPLSLNNVKFTAVEGYSYSPDIDKFIAKKPSTVNLDNSENSLDANIALVESGKFDALIEDEQVMHYHLNELKKSASFNKVGCTRFKKLYIAFSPKLAEQSKRYTEILSAGLKTMKANGELSTLYKKYGLTAPTPDAGGEEADSP
jgi:polar amino acid transport system substrate-binding protein